MEDLRNSTEVSKCCLNEKLFAVLSLKRKMFIYSVVGLVCPRGEEQISGPSAVSKFKRPSKR